MGHSGWLEWCACVQNVEGVIEMSLKLKCKIPRYGLGYYSMKMILIEGEREKGGRQTDKRKEDSVSTSALSCDEPRHHYK